MKQEKKYIEYNTDLKKNQRRLFKILSIINKFSKNSELYKQDNVLYLLNIFLKRDNLKPISLKTLRKDLAFLIKKGIIKKFIKRLGEYKGTEIRYALNNYSFVNLRRELKSKSAIFEADVNAKFEANKENEDKFFVNKKGRKKGSVLITINNKYINKREELEKIKIDKENEVENSKNLIDNIIYSKTKFKKLKYLNTVSRNNQKKNLESSRNELKSRIEKEKKEKEILEWLKDFETDR